MSRHPLSLCPSRCGAVKNCDQVNQSGWRRTGLHPRCALQHCLETHGRRGSSASTFPFLVHESEVFIIIIICVETLTFYSTPISILLYFHFFLLDSVVWMTSGQKGNHMFVNFMYALWCGGQRKGMERREREKGQLVKG